MSSQSSTNVEDNNGGKRIISAIFGQRFRAYMTSSGESASDIDTDGEMINQRKRSMGKLGRFLYASKQNANTEGNNVSVGAPSESQQSHLLTLVREKRAMKKYADKLLSDSHKKPTNDSVISESERSDNASVIGVDEGRMKPVDSNASITVSGDSRDGSFRDSKGYALSAVQKEEAERLSKGIFMLEEAFKEYSHLIKKYPIEIRMENLTYSVPHTKASGKITTVYNSSIVYKLVRAVKRLATFGEDKNDTQVTYTKHVLDDISLCLKPGKMYLVLGPPGSGKSSLLKAIAGRLYHRKNEDLKGSVTYNGQELYNSKGFYDHPDMHHENAISFIDQLDRHAPRYTVKETFNFAFQCKRHKGSHIDFRFEEDTPGNRELAKTADENNLLVDTYIKVLGIDHVRDTFVGNDEIRGVSGGQRRRVTIGEMLMNNSPIICGDEISNGLDAESTFEIITAMSYIGKVREKLQVISLLQPSPETLAIFDEVILLAEGKLLYAGPVLRVEGYFASLGYVAPLHMDVGDFLQIISTPDGAEFYDPPSEIGKKRPKPYTLDELADEFRKSHLGQRLTQQIKEPSKRVWGSLHGNLPDQVNMEDDIHYLDDRKYRSKYQNNFGTFFWLNLKRQITLWRRDKRVLIANAVKNSIMGISVGGVFYQTTDVISILGVLFQGMLFVMLGGMVTAPAFVNERLIYYKQNDANFYGAFSFIFAKTISKLPQTAMDCIIFGTILYFMVGLAPQAEYYFTFMGIVFVFNVLMSEFLFVFSTFAATSSIVQVASACIVFIFMLFCGFFIPPITIPSYFKWIYWYNPLAWAYRALVVNAFRNTEYTKEDADAILTRYGFVDSTNNPFDRTWITYAFAFMCGHILLSVLASATILSCVRVHKKPPPSLFDPVGDEKNDGDANGDSDKVGDDYDAIIPFKPVTLSFDNICYDVKASTGEESIRLLHNVNGYFKAGRMCALMGESGAGKTTLMDVIAMRKNTGTVNGDIRINGFPQERSSFRRCSGYVEQFDIQSPQLTVRETVLFSALLRLDSTKINTTEEKETFCDRVIGLLELTPLSNCLVGSDEEGGLSFEQKKRLSIAVELAASPSIIFLDEPTTGLDSRSASLVVKLLRKIANQGRTICATIHQPSSAVFDMFDDLLLLKKGGRSVYFGELGFESNTLIEYFERHGATKIKPGDNPANWMLRVLPECEEDFADLYARDPIFSKMLNQVEAVKLSPPEVLEVKYLTEFAVPRSVRQKLTNTRLRSIYWRSPAYNLSRLMVCAVIAFILGSVFVTERNLEVLTEDKVTAYFSVTFLSFIIIGILSITSVLPVMLAIRDVFYKQLAAGMIDNSSLGWALGIAEMGFIVLASFIFCLIFLATAGTSPISFLRALRFWGFFTFNLAIYSYFGQAFMCLVPTMATAQILCSVFIGLNNFFSGLIVRPQYMRNIFAITYWITPGHFVYEGLILSQFWGDERMVIANEGSEFYHWLGCDKYDYGRFCHGTVEQYVWVFYGEMFHKGNFYMDILVLALFLIFARAATFYALRRFQYTNT